MKNSKIKLVTIIVLLALFIIQMPVLATNDKIEMLYKNSDDTYLIYIKDHLNSAFEFAISEDGSADKNSLSYIQSGIDTVTQGEQTNNVAFVQQTPSKTQYMWARTLSGEYFLEGIELSFNDWIDDNDMNLVNNITKLIKVNTSNKETNAKTEDGVVITEILGKVELVEEGSYHYQLIKLPNGDKYNRLIEIAQKIENNQTGNDMYEKLEFSRELINLYNELKPTVDDKNWIQVENRVIKQPIDAQSGDKYILWIKQDSENQTVIDAQFLTAFREFDQDYVKEEVRTNLPVTYDSIVLLVTLGVLIIALVLVYLLRKKSAKKQDK